MSSLLPFPLPALETCLLGREGRQRALVLQALVAWLLYALWAAVQQAAVLLGLVDPDASNALTLFTLGGATAFYLLMRSGVNQIVSREPRLGFAQAVFGLLAASAAYAISGPLRGAALLLMMAVMGTAAVALPRRQVRWLAVIGLSLLAGVMLCKLPGHAAVHAPGVEALHFVVVACMMVAVERLSRHLGALRQRLHDQKDELATALQRHQALAVRDSLTGLLNRRAMLEQVQREVRRAQRNDHGAELVTGLVLFDLDHFKRVNDTLGHRVGDRVLQAFGELAAAELRSSDMLARWGGEQFLLLLPNTSAEAALACVERIRQRLLSWRYEGPLPVDSADAASVSFSAGLAACRREHEIEAAITRAEQAMLRAKAAGRDRSELDAGLQAVLRPAASAGEGEVNPWARAPRP